MRHRFLLGLIPAAHSSRHHCVSPGCIASSLHAARSYTSCHHCVRSVRIVSSLRAGMTSQHAFAAHQLNKLEPIC
ncbi:hypothetical protein PF005_g30692 [Phytophthora fragariae]|uniref:Uncharacterized protein n=1 Tax=Phytophthora fragariae TaxID=53985 RepID=A0A6A3V877_9STRA|nr:hypothetical protein PF003_g40914 [Phytophthora fragariae]KAE8966715.1 hypothetical protein PF011_g27837 [Phytophthora fragariae]KAE9058438.1 hypothetical protein PF010_g31000 [Phytophthora fragariae]KAE9162840.1 hypothetical protein PF005_g30692 [Phytophthora fragariae]KAE9168651.1 hypothetical protein PF004_g28439 [Phytophthora fragariae]